MAEKKSEINRNNPGPKPETIKAEGVDWKDALSHALNKPKPKAGWPKEGKPKDEEKKP